MLNIAHRGASGRFPENTLRAFRAAIEAGADMCELDVQLSRDDVLVVIHDDKVDRTTDGRGAVNSFTIEHLKRLDAGAGFSPEFTGERIPTLDEVFELTEGRCGLNIELKATGIEHKVCGLVESWGAAASTLLSSFDWNALARVRHFASNIRTGLLSSRSSTRLLETAIRMKADAINPRFDIVTEDLCMAAHQHSISVYAWTVDDPAVMRALIGCGVDGIMTNYPERLAEVMDWR